MEAPQVQKPLLTIKIDGLRSKQGAVCIALFSSAEGFPNESDKAVKAEYFPISEIPLTLTFADLPFGRYAATVFHDENEDGKLNTGVLGIPKEGFGFSENPQVWTGPPKFQQADFEFTPSSTTFEIAIKYF